MLNAAGKLSKVRSKIVSTGFLGKVLIGNPKESDFREIMVKGRLEQIKK